MKSSEATMFNAELGSMIPHAHQLPTQNSPFIDSGVHLDLLARSSSNVLAQNQQETDDDVFVEESPTNIDAQAGVNSSLVDLSGSSNTMNIVDSNAPSNGLSRSRRSHFSRKDSTPEMANKAKSDSKLISFKKIPFLMLEIYTFLDEPRIIHTMKSLWWFYSNLPLCKNLPQNFDLIRENCPGIIREKVIDLVCGVISNENVCITNITGHSRVGSGRILRKAFSSSTSKSFDGWVEGKHETSKGFRRATSTLCLDHSPPHPKMVSAVREA